MATTFNIAQYGFNARTLITNASCIFGMASGVAAIHPDTFIECKLNKSKPFPVNFDSLPSGARQFFMEGQGKEHGIAKMQDWLKDKLDAIIAEGKTYEPGEVILQLKEKGKINHTFFRNSLGLNQPAKLVGYKFPKAIKSVGFFKSEIIKIQLIFELHVTDQWFKLRNDAVKCTTAPTVLKFYDLTGKELDIKWDILLPMESLKGQLSKMIAYATAHVQGNVDLETGIMHTDAGDVDITQAHNQINDWLKGGAVKTVWVEFEMAASEYKAMIKSRGEHEDLELIKEGKGYVLLREKIQMLETPYLFEVEVSTPRENSGPSDITLEMLASMALQSRKLAESINLSSVPRREAVNAMLSMILRKADNTLPTYNLTNASERAALVKVVGKYQDLDDASVVDLFGRHFPEGVFFCATSSNTGKLNHIFMDFNAVRGMSTFIGGVAEGIGSDITAFLKYVNAPGESGADSNIFSKISQIASGIEAWGMQCLEAQSVLKRLTRSSGAVGLKVRTLPWFEINHEQGELPKVALNPNDDCIKLLAKNSKGEYLLKYCDLADKADPRPAAKTNNAKAEEVAAQAHCKYVFNAESLAGEYIAPGRLPMPMLTACELVLSERVGVAHAVILPHIWAHSNEGDTDGDGIILINLGMHGLTLADCLAMNTHLMSTLGYWLVYSSDATQHPCAEFVEYAAKWGKKALIWEADKEEKYLMPYLLESDIDEYANKTVVVNKHYISAVGIAYNICVVLTHKACNLQYCIWNLEDSNGDAEQIKLFKGKLQLLIMAMVVSWRLLYEGKGLGGFTPEANRFFSLLVVAAFNSHYIEKEEDGVKIITYPQKSDPASSKKNCLDELIYLGESSGGGISQNLKVTKADGSEVNLAKAVMNEIVIACNTSFSWGAVEKAKASSERLSASGRRDAVLYGALRRAGQGYDPAGLAELSSFEDAADDNDEDLILPVSLFSECLKKETWNNYNCSWIQTVIQQACQVHTKASRILYNSINADVED